MKQTFIGLTFLIFTTPAVAHDKEAHYDRISLTANAGKEVQQDELRASLYAMSEDEDAKISAQRVSRKIKAALDILNRQKDITVQTGSFNTHPVYRKKQITGWRSRHTISLKSQDPTKLSEILGKVLDHVKIERIRYGVSDESKATAENNLISKAIAHFRTRAQLISKEMGREKYRVVNMNVSTNQHGPVFRQEMAMATRADATIAPPIKAGTQRIQVNISGTIEIQLKQ